MTSSLKTPLTFNNIEESSSFDEIKNSQIYEVIMISPSNFNYYLNVHQVQNSEGEQIQKNPKLSITDPSKEVDLNGYWIIEVE